MQELTIKGMTLKHYFEKIREMQETGHPFPADLDSVWPLIYSRKDHAVRDLKSSFFESTDYQVSLKNGENSNGGRPGEMYALSVSCLEYFIVRKVREVFAVYQAVFHKAVSQALPDFNNPVVAARAWADKVEALMLAEEKVKELEPKAKAAEVLLSSDDTVSIGDFAKAIGYGPNKLFQWMRDKKYIIGKNNIAYQRYIQAGYFKVIEVPKQYNDQTRIHSQTRITPHGQVYFTSKLK